MSSHNHLFFDLDRTLWDFDNNSRDALLEIIDALKLVERGVNDSETFIAKYKAFNEYYWALYREHKIDKETLRDIRFKKALETFGVVDDSLVQEMARLYISISPLKTKLLPGTIEVLEYLCEDYALHIITNGFEEVQHIKLKNSGLQPYFRNIITSERAGYKKPNAEIFEFSMALSGAKANESVMIGDDFYADIIGARSVGMTQVFLNVDNVQHNEDISHEISKLIELKQIF
jgi:putative hydrolase of the HAD superfamily